ncbi:MAG: peptidase M14, partial [Algoriphagus sp.]
MKTINLKHTLTALALGALSLSSLNVYAQQENYFRAIGTPHTPKVEIAWNRYYSAEGLWDLMKKIAVAHPKIARIESIG